MDIEQVKREIKEIGKSPVAEKMYPITSDWVPIADVFAIIDRFEKHWKAYAESKRTAEEKQLIGVMLGKK
jgi:hypothetical protein